MQGSFAPRGEGILGAARPTPRGRGSFALRGKGRLSEQDVKDAMKEIRAKEAAGERIK